MFSAINLVRLTRNLVVAAKVQVLNFEAREALQLGAPSGVVRDEHSELAFAPFIQLECKVQVGVGPRSSPGPTAEYVQRDHVRRVNCSLVGQQLASPTWECQTGLLDNLLELGTLLGCAVVVNAHASEDSGNLFEGFGARVARLASWRFETSWSPLPPGT